MNNLPTLRISRYDFCFLVTLCIPLLSCTALSVRSGQIQPQQARTADSFVDSIGVVTHLGYTGTSYGNYNGIIKPRLQELGVRHIRDGGKGKAMFDKLNDLATIGIKSTLVMDPRDGTQPQDAVTIAKSIPKSLEAVEGPNEWDINPGATYKGQSFPNGLRNYQNDLYKAINSDPATANISVLTPSLAGPGNADKLEPLDTFDKGNIHYYVKGNKSAWGLDNYVLPQIKELTGNKPLIVTETGWSNVAISQQAEAKYVPRLYLEHFNRGIERTFLYEFIKERQEDNSYEGNWGILNPDGSPQPAFIALKNLILLLKDPGTNFPLKPLGYNLSGDTAGVRHTLLQQRNGAFYVILWQDTNSWDNKNKKALVVPKRKVTLTLDTVISKADFYLPTFSVTPTWQSTAQNRHLKQLRVTVPDHPLVIRLVTGG